VKKARKLRKSADDVQNCTCFRVRDDEILRIERRPRRYVARHWLIVLAPLFAYNHSRDAYVLRIGGRHIGPVLRPDRRVQRERPADGTDRRRRASMA
jgi:hypothetical protein